MRTNSGQSFSFSLIFKGNANIFFIASHKPFKVLRDVISFFVVLLHYLLEIGYISNLAANRRSLV